MSVIHIEICGAKKNMAELFSEQLLDVLEKDGTFKKDEILITHKEEIFLHNAKESFYLRVLSEDNNRILLASQLIRKMFAGYVETIKIAYEVF